jgi:tRNA (adenine37-N6)-methyltransferase
MSSVRRGEKLLKSFEIKPIGFIESCYRDKFGTPRQPGLAPSSLARLQIAPEYQPEQSLQGLKQFSHVWLIWMFHQNTNARFHAKVHPPRLGGETIGVFATRSPHRPNPIGLSLVKLVEVEAHSIVVAGADLVDGTPILDIKPYLPEVESVPDALGGWTRQAQKPNWKIKASAAIEAEIATWAAQKNISGLRNLIEETLLLDPRPLVYRGFEGQESPYRDSHAVRLYDGDIHFRFNSENEIEILKVIWNLDDFNINKR